MSMINDCLNHSILRPLVQTCNSLRGRSQEADLCLFKRIALVFLAFLSIALSAIPVAAAVVPGDLNIIDATYGEGAGSFELGSFENNGNNFMTLVPGSTTITGWTVGKGGVDWLTPPTFGAKQGIHSVDLTTSSPSDYPQFSRLG